MGNKSNEFRIEEDLKEAQDMFCELDKFLKANEKS